MSQEQEPPSSSPGNPETVSGLTMQETVGRLRAFWEAQGCLRLPPCDFSAPFATLHPDAFFRILGPEPWRVAFVQPVRRPLDGRFGEHPYRLAKHHQLEIVLKPPPSDLRSLYLESLETLGLRLGSHDVRFVEWRWEPRSLGARGSGWHAVIDGLGVTRLTILQRLANRDLDPPSVEISYGLERLLLPLQGAESVYDVDWAPGGIDYARLRRRDERESSRYVFQIADIDDLWQRLEALDREAERCLEAGVVRPAYELAVRCLEPIDLLEARGAASARQRGLWLDRVRQRVVAAADLHEASGVGPSPESEPMPEVAAEDPGEPSPGDESVDESPAVPEAARPKRRATRRKPARKKPAARARKKPSSKARKQPKSDAEKQPASKERTAPRRGRKKVSASDEREGTE